MKCRICALDGRQNLATLSGAYRQDALIARPGMGYNGAFLSGEGCHHLSRDSLSPSAKRIGLNTSITIVKKS